VKETKKVPMSSLEEDLSSLLNQEKYADVVFEVEGQKIYAHRSILSARCEFFRNLFGSGMKEAKDSIIKMEENTYTGLHAFLSYLYTGRFPEISTETAFEILQLAESYFLTHLKYECEKIIINGISVENVVSILLEAEKYSAEDLKKTCMNYIEKHKNEIDKENLMNLPKELLVAIYMGGMK
jgi:cobalamin biosynthesis protein CbiD